MTTTQKMSPVDEILYVNADALKATVLKRANYMVIQGDWAVRKHEAGNGFEEREIVRLKRAVAEAKDALYFRLLELELADHYTANPPPPPDSV